MAVYVQFEGNRAVTATLSDTPLEAPWMEAPDGSVVGDPFKLVDGEVELMSDAEVEAQQAEIEAELYAVTNRAKRNSLLTNCDWVVIKALESGEAVPAAWVTYRQGLRDMPDHTEWPLVDENDWPAAP